jgi:peptidoglycan/LPS O-acetylase OafA/YrhL
MWCKACKFPLNQSGGDVCPNCGRAFDRLDERTFFLGPQPIIRTAVYAFVFGVISVVSMLASSFVSSDMTLPFYMAPFFVILSALCGSIAIVLGFHAKRKAALASDWRGRVFAESAIFLGIFGVIGIFLVGLPRVRK